MIFEYKCIDTWQVRIWTLKSLLVWVCGSESDLSFFSYIMDIKTITILPYLISNFIHYYPWIYQWHVWITLLMCTIFAICNENFWMNLTWKTAWLWQKEEKKKICFKEITLFLSFVHNSISLMLTHIIQSKKM